MKPLSSRPLHLNATIETFSSLTSGQSHSISKIGQFTSIAERPRTAKTDPSDWWSLTRIPASPIGSTPHTTTTGSWLFDGFERMRIPNLPSESCLSKQYATGLTERTIPLGTSDLAPIHVDDLTRQPRSRVRQQEQTCFNQVRGLAQARNRQLVDDLLCHGAGGLG